MYKRILLSKISICFELLLNIIKLNPYFNLILFITNILYKKDFMIIFFIIYDDLGNKQFNK